MTVRGGGLENVQATLTAVGPNLRSVQLPRGLAASLVVNFPNQLDDQIEKIADHASS